MEHVLRSVSNEQEYKTKTSPEKNPPQICKILSQKIKLLNVYWLLLKLLSVLKEII